MSDLDTLAKEILSAEWLDGLAVFVGEDWSDDVRPTKVGSLQDLQAMVREWQGELPEGAEKIFEQASKHYDLNAMFLENVFFNISAGLRGLRHRPPPETPVTTHGEDNDTN